jgi:hypothetical protein
MRTLSLPFGDGGVYPLVGKRPSLASQLDQELTISGRSEQRRGYHRHRAQPHASRRIPHFARYGAVHRRIPNDAAGPETLAPGFELRLQ